MSTTPRSFANSPWVLPGDTLILVEVLALIGAVVWILALVWFVLRDVFRVARKHPHDAEDDHAPRHDERRHTGSGPEGRRPSR